MTLEVIIENRNLRVYALFTVGVCLQLSLAAREVDRCINTSVKSIVHHTYFLKVVGKLLRTPSLSGHLINVWFGFVIHTILPFAEYSQYC